MATGVSSGEPYSAIIKVSNNEERSSFQQSSKQHHKSTYIQNVADRIDIGARRLFVLCNNLSIFWVHLNPDIFQPKLCSIGSSSNG
jgi:hypothetical protein